MLIPVILGVVVLVFTILYVAPGDPAIMSLGENASQESIQEYREELGINGGYFDRLGRYILGLSHGDLGLSYRTRAPVAQELAQRLEKTFVIATLSILIGAAFGIICGIISAVKQYSVFDWLSTFFALLGISAPTFATGLFLIIIFSVNLNWFPASGYGLDNHLVLPVICLGIASIGMIMRTTRSSMLDVLKQDYITTAKAKGQSNGSIIFKHALRNALMPIVTVVGLQYVNLLSGSMVAEAIFSIPGSGRYMIEGIEQRNYAAVLGAVILLAVIAAVINLLTDIMYTYIDPRLRTEQTRKRKKSQGKGVARVG